MSRVVAKVRAGIGTETSRKSFMALVHIITRCMLETQSRILWLSSTSLQGACWRPKSGFYDSRPHHYKVHAGDPKPDFRKNWIRSGLQNPEDTILGHLFTTKSSDRTSLLVCGGVTVYVWHKPTELAHSFLFCSCVSEHQLTNPSGWLGSKDQLTNSCLCLKIGEGGGGCPRQHFTRTNDYDWRWLKK